MIGHHPCEAVRFFRGQSRSLAEDPYEPTLEVDRRSLCLVTLRMEPRTFGLPSRLQGRSNQIEVGSARQAESYWDGLALPGMTNVHSLAFQRGFAGLTEYVQPPMTAFWTWRAKCMTTCFRLDPEKRFTASPSTLPRNAPSRLYVGW